MRARLMQQRPRVGTPTFHAMSACFLSMSQGRQHLLPTAQTIVRCRCPDSNWRRRPSNSDEWTRRAGAVLAQPLVPQHGAPHGLLGGKQKEGGGCAPTQEGGPSVEDLNVPTQEPKMAFHDRFRLLFRPLHGSNTPVRQALVTASKTRIKTAKKNTS